MSRHLWVLVHRYAGLFMAFFLIVIGLTGSIIAFNTDIDHWLSPPFKVVVRNEQQLDQLTLLEHAQALIPQGMVTLLSLNRKPDEAFTVFVQPRIDPVSGKTFNFPMTTLVLDPYTGKEISREKIDDSLWPITRKNLLTLINRLHYQLAIPGLIGSYLFGIVALVWTIDCFVSGYLTFPVSVRRSEKSKSTSTKLKHRSWWSRWWNPAWQVKWKGSAYRINFDLHRAGGLWVWLMLLVLAWSSVGFNLSEEVYTPVMKAVFNMPDPFGDLPKLNQPQIEPKLAWREAHTIGQRLMTEQASLNHFNIQREESLMYDQEKGVFIYNVRSDRDLMDDYGGTMVLFEGNTGKFDGLSLPTGQNLGGTIHTWIFTLHEAMIWGLPFKIFVSSMGILIAMLSITGVYIWLKKRNARKTSQEKRALIEQEAST